MRSKLTKTLALVAASIVGTTCAYSAPRYQDHTQDKKPCYEQGHTAQQHNMLGGYNAPARIDVSSSWDFNVQGGFIYWQAIEEGLDFAFSGDANADPLILPNLNQRIIGMNWKYKPGFKVGVGYGFDYDKWDLYVEYTRLHGSISTSSIEPNFSIGKLRPIWLHFTNAVFIGPADSAQAKWEHDFDFLDAELARSSYVGTKLTFRSYFGVRAAWIDQKFNVTYQYNTIDTDTFSNSKSDSWALGPRVGLDTNWMLGYGFRLVGNVNAALLYTRYKFRHAEGNQQQLGTSQFDMTVRSDSYLRPSLDMLLGIGWGMYFAKNSWHIDFFASYDYKAFWNQNMMRFYLEQTGTTTASFDHDLYLQGLTLMARIDF